MKTLLFILITPFILGLLVSLLELLTVKRNFYKYAANSETVKYDPVLEEQKENLDRQIDGYNQLLIMLDKQYSLEDDPRKKAVILNKQLTTLEKYNKTMEKRKKLGE